MIRLQQFFFGERSVTKVAGLFATRSGAEIAMHDLLGSCRLSATQVNVLSPLDGNPARDEARDRAVEPEQRGIWLTVIRAHLSMGLLGLLAGVLLYAALMAMDNAALRSTPGMGLVALAGFGATFGLMLGGVLALRPAHGRVIGIVRGGLQRGQWAVVAHPLDSRQTRQAMASLNHGSLRVMRSF